MFAFVLSFIGSDAVKGLVKFATSKAGLITFGVIGAFIGAIYAVHHFEQVGHDKAMAEQKAATAIVQARLDASIAVANTQAAVDAQRITDKESTNASILATIGRLAPANAGRGCLDADGVRRHNALRLQKAVQQPGGSATAR
jgi:hypothetical protein